MSISTKRGDAGQTGLAGGIRVSKSGEAVEPNVLAYLNRLSDLIWLFGGKLEFDAGVNGSLRAANNKPGPRWSRAW
jgi:cob(I)alamin adenosyltransferase